MDTPNLSDTNPGDSDTPAIAYNPPNATTATISFDAHTRMGSTGSRSTSARSAVTTSTLAVISGLSKSRCWPRISTSAHG